MQSARLELVLAFDAAGLMLTFCAVIMGVAGLLPAAYILIADCIRTVLHNGTAASPPRESRPRPTEKMVVLQRERCETINIVTTVADTCSRGTQGIDPHHGQLRDLVGYQRLTAFIRGGGRFTV